MSEAWKIIRRWHLHLLMIGIVRLVAGQQAAHRYIDRRAGL